MDGSPFLRLAGRIGMVFLVSFLWLGFLALFAGFLCLLYVAVSAGGAWSAVGGFSLGVLIRVMWREFGASR
jgi:hypothetical protein